MRKVWRLFFLRSSQARYKQDYQSEILKWCGNSCEVDPWSDKGTVDLYARVYVSRGIKNVCVVVWAMEIPFSKRRILHSYSWLGQCREIGKLSRFYFDLTITYVPLCGGYVPVSQFFRKLRSFEDGPLLSIGWISLFRNFILVQYYMWPFHVETTYIIPSLYIYCVFQGKEDLMHFFSRSHVKISESGSMEVWLQGHPTTIFGKYLFGRRFEI